VGSHLGATIHAPTEADSAIRVNAKKGLLLNRIRGNEKPRPSGRGRVDHAAGEYLARLFIRPLATRTAHRVELTGTSSVGSGLDFFGGGPEYFRMSPFTWQDNELIPVLMAKPAE
jgi:microsomal dipeptidase-like Zn-dependent dipeptidase